jgi:glyoxylase-like metal-dependent hydrolase (beta-lactamase superfamily II)
VAGPDFSIRPLCYAHVDLPAEFFGGVPIHSGEGVRPGAMLYVLLSERDAAGTVHHHLVDVGFGDNEWKQRFPFRDYEPPDVVLGKLGIAPADIEKVFVSHMHFDHVNALPAFPNAQVYVQWAEWEGWSRALALPELYTPHGAQSWVTSSFDRGDLAVFARLAAEQRLHFVDDGEELHPGITAHLSPGGHTFGIQWLSVATPDGDLVVASDTAMWYSNIEEMWPSGYTNGSTWQMVLTYGEIHRHVGGDLGRVVPGHDLEVFARVPSWTEGANEVGELRVAGWDTSARPAGAVAS